MSTETQPAVSESMREAVAQHLDGMSHLQGAALIEFLLRPSGPIASEIDRLTERAEKAEAVSADLAQRYKDVCLARCDDQADVARLTGERDAAREDHVRAEAHICALEVLAYIDPEHTWKDAAIKERVAKVAAEAALSRLQADRDAEVGKLKTACDHYEKALSHLWDGGSVLATDELAAARKAHRAALTETPDA